MSSFDRYLIDSCHVHVIWNDLGTIGNFQLTRHTYTVYAREAIIDWALVSATGVHSGWHTQQILKLLIGQRIQSDYLIFDSQLCLIGPVTWAELVAQAQLHDTQTSSRFHPWLEGIALAQGWAMQPVLAPQSPYWFDWSVVQQIFDIWTQEQLVLLFMSASAPSEYHLHDLVRQTLTDIRYTGTCPNMQTFINRANRLATVLNPQYRITSIPSTFWLRARPVFLARFGLDFEQHIMYN